MSSPKRRRRKRHPINGRINTNSDEGVEERFGSWEYKGFLSRGFPATASTDARKDTAVPLPRHRSTPFSKAQAERRGHSKVDE